MEKRRKQKLEKKKDHAKLVESRAEALGRGDPCIGSQSSSPKPPHDNNGQGIGGKVVLGFTNLNCVV